MLVSICKVEAEGSTSKPHLRYINSTYSENGGSSKHDSLDVLRTHQATEYLKTLCLKGSGGSAGGYWKGCGV
jgi:hypothetical protein